VHKFRLLIPVGFAAIAAAFCATVMLLWNWLMPVIFGLPVISFGQALGLLVLSKILLGGRHWGHSMSRCHRNQIREKWLKMTPEEQKEFLKKKHFGSRFKQHFGADENFEKQS
jgi:hypothetical protein